MIFFENKKSKKKYVVLFLLILIISITFFLMVKYNVEGEKNVPFNIKQLMIISSAETQELELNDEGYQAEVIQKNDIYLVIEKNEKYKKQDAIKRITINNFNIINEGRIGKLNIYRTSMTEKNFEYSDNYKVNNDLVFLGDLNTNLKMENMTISNQGGLLEFSMILADLGKITYDENESITSDGTLIKKLNLNTEDIKISVSFDVTIELSSGNAFKTCITAELPIGDIANEGVCKSENIDLNKLVFKRV